MLLDTGSTFAWGSASIPVHAISGCVAETMFQGQTLMTMCGGSYTADESVTSSSDYDAGWMKNEGWGGMDVKGKCCGCIADNCNTDYLCGASPSKFLPSTFVCTDVSCYNL